MSNHIPVFCATDENYAPFASLMMKSVLMHTDSFIDFYIMDGGIKEKTKELILKDLKQYPNKELHFVDMKKYDLNQFLDVSYYSVNMYSRYFIPAIVPHLSKVIYLDVDIIVKRDIKELFQQDLEGYPLTALCETKYYNAKIGNRLKRVYSFFNGQYFNSGVLLMDIPKLIQMDFTNKAVCLTTAINDRIDCPDQDVLNILFENNYKQLDITYNYVVFAKNQIKKSVKKDVSPCVIHYAGAKPWKDHCPLKQDFEDVLKSSIFYKQIVKKYRAKKSSKYYLFGFIPLFEKVVLK